MGFTEEEFYRTPMEVDDKTWVRKYLDYSTKADEFEVEQPNLRGRRGRRSSAPWSTIDEFQMVAGQYYSDLLKVLVDKQRDYGPKNISLAPGGPINGLLVRMNDKMQRLINLTYNNAGDDPTNEAIRDSYADLANYCVIAMMVLDNKWDGNENV
jgi:hypothetical protein